MNMVLWVSQTYTGRKEDRERSSARMKECLCVSKLVEKEKEMIAKGGEWVGDRNDEKTSFTLSKNSFC